MVLVVVLLVALAVALALPVFGPMLNRFAETWFVGALFSSWLLFWSSVLFTGLVSAVVVVVGWSVLKRRCVFVATGRRLVRNNTSD